MVIHRIVREVLYDHNRKSKSKIRLRQVSTEQTYRIDLLDYENEIAVIDKIEEITEHLKNKHDNYLKIRHNDHELKGKLHGYRSLSLYPGRYRDEDIIIIYKVHNKGNHIVFNSIGSHEDVYG